MDVKHKTTTRRHCTKGGKSLGNQYSHVNKTDYKMLFDVLQRVKFFIFSSTTSERLDFKHLNVHVFCTCFALQSKVLADKIASKI